MLVESTTWSPDFLPYFNVVQIHVNNGFKTKSIQVIDFIVRFCLVCKGAAKREILLLALKCFVCNEKSRMINIHITWELVNISPRDNESGLPSIEPY